jgi:hypothetical protein
MIDTQTPKTDKLTKIASMSVEERVARMFEIADPNDQTPEHRQEFAVLFNPSSLTAA